MKCYLQNSHGEIRRVDKIKAIQSVLPKDSDYSRRVLLCSQNGIPFQPYILEMNNEEFKGFMVLAGDAKPTNSGIRVYQIFDNAGIIILNIVNYGK